jgi:hypothetical protein
VAAIPAAECKYLNNTLEQDHRRIKRLTGPGLRLGSFRTARRTLDGHEATALIRKGQVRKIIGRDIKPRLNCSNSLPDQLAPRAHARSLIEICNRAQRVYPHSLVHLGRCAGEPTRHMQPDGCSGWSALQSENSHRAGRANQSAREVCHDVGL